MSEGAPVGVLVEQRPSPLLPTPLVDIQPSPVQIYLRRWSDFAACKDLPLDTMDPDKVGEQKWLRSICIGCPVRKICLNNGIINKRPGVWGGTTEEERVRLQRNRGFVQNLQTEVRIGEIEQQANALRTPQRMRQFAEAARSGRANAQIIFEQGPQPEDIQRPPIEDPDRPRAGETIVGWYSRMLEEISQDLRESVPSTFAARKYFGNSEPTIKQALRKENLVDTVEYYYASRVKRRRLETLIETTLARCEQEGTSFPMLKELVNESDYSVHSIGEVIIELRKDQSFDARFSAMATRRPHKRSGI